MPDNQNQSLAHELQSLYRCSSVQMNAALSGEGPSTMLMLPHVVDELPNGYSLLAADLTTATTVNQGEACLAVANSAPGVLCMT